MVGLTGGPEGRTLIRRAARLAEKGARAARYWPCTSPAATARPRRPPRSSPCSAPGRRTGRHLPPRRRRRHPGRPARLRPRGQRHSDSPRRLPPQELAVHLRPGRHSRGGSGSAQAMRCPGQATTAVDVCLAMRLVEATVIVSPTGQSSPPISAASRRRAVPPPRSAEVTQRAGNSVWALLPWYTQCLYDCLHQPPHRTLLRAYDRPPEADEQPPGAKRDEPDDRSSAPLTQRLLFMAGPRQE